MMSEAQSLVRLQEIDLQATRLRAKLADMPQAKTLAAIAKKTEEVSEKSKKVSAMRSECELEMQALVDEDAELVSRGEDLEVKIAESSEFRQISSLTRELEGVAKRRNKVAFDHGKLSDRIAKISAVEDQIADALAKLDAQRASVEAEIESTAADAKARLEELAAEFEAQARTLGQDTLKKFAAVKASKGGIAVATLQGTHCSVCRVELPEGKLIALTTGPEITECPNCHRMMVVEKG